MKFIPVGTEEYLTYQNLCLLDPVFGSRSWTALQAYGPGQSDPAFWLGIQGEEPVAAIHLSGEVLTIVGEPDLDRGILADFIWGHKVTEIDTTYERAKDLQRVMGGSLESSYYMVYDGGKFPGDFSTVQPYRSLEEVYAVLRQSHEYYRTHLRFQQWAEDMQRKLDKGLVELYQVNQNDEPIGTGCIVSWDERCGVIAAVAVIPEHRHQGLGGSISKALVNRILDCGKTPHLISGYDAVAELYRQIGFRETGRWGELYL